MGKATLASFLAAVSFLAILSPALAADLPRYKLEVGRKLTYTTTSVSESTEAKSGSEKTYCDGRAEITVVGQNADGSFHLLIKEATKYRQVGDGRSASPETLSETVSTADLFPDGRLISGDAMPTSKGNTYLPKLPTDEQELANGWTWSDPEKFETLQYRRVDSAEGKIAFEFTSKSPMNDIYQVTSLGTAIFDPEKGIMVSGTTRGTQDYGFHSKTSGTLQLISDEKIAPEQAALLGNEQDDVAVVKKHCQALSKQIDADPARFDAIEAEITAYLAAEKVKATDDVVKAAIEKLAVDTQHAEKSSKEWSDRIAQVLDKPAADWSATDIAGHPIALADLKGKVVVMDFWYRGCGWCMYAMPQVKQLAADFAGQPVVVLGMNTDEVLDDARVVIKAMDLPYNTVQATGIPEKYGVRAFPTLIIVDQTGVVRAVHIGYSATLHDEIGDDIHKLLKNNPSTQPAMGAAK